MKTENRFVLKNRRTFKRSLNIYVPIASGKVNKKNIAFTTEHLVPKEQRSTNAMKVAAQYLAINELEVDALMTNSAYGITYVRIDDPEGKLKKETRIVTSEDAEKAALKNLFEVAGLEFDPLLQNSVLKAQYAINLEAKGGIRKIEKSTISSIPSTPVDIVKNMQDGIASAKALFAKNYGYEVPAVVSNDLAFFDGISNPEFDAEAYIASKTAPLEEEVKVKEVEETIEVLRQKYFEKLGTKVPNPKNQDSAWIKSKLL